jgi:hypothetical protein
MRAEATSTSQTSLPTSNPRLSPSRLFRIRKKFESSSKTMRPTWSTPMPFWRSTSIKRWRSIPNWEKKATSSTAPFLASIQGISCRPATASKCSTTSRGSTSLLSLTGSSPCQRLTGRFLAIRLSPLTAKLLTELRDSHGSRTTQ